MSCQIRGRSDAQAGAVVVHISNLPFNGINRDMYGSDGFLIICLSMLPDFLICVDFEFGDIPPPFLLAILSILCSQLREIKEK